MRPFSAISAAFLIVCAVSAIGRADTPPAVAPPAVAAAVVSPPPAPSCLCHPRLHHVWRRHRRVRHVRYWRHRQVVRVVVVRPPPPPYNPWLPTADDSAYDRAMTLHFRSPMVTGIALAEPGYPPTPPVRGIYPYRYAAGPAAFQYDGITGEYIALSQYDARRIVPPPPVPLVPLVPR